MPNETPPQLADTGSITIAYGTEAVPRQVAAAIAEGRALSRPGAPVGALPAAGTVRMSDVRHPFTIPPVAQDLVHAEAQLAFLEGHLLSLCGAWAKPQAAFVAAYFEALREHVARDAEALDRRTGPLAGLVEPLHWCFAAPMPFPRAHPGLTEAGRIASSDAATTVRVDFLFRTSRGLLACIVDDATPLGRRRRELDALEGAGVRVKRPKPGLASPELLDRLGPEFADFTRDVAFPESPFRGRPMQRPA